MPIDTSSMLARLSPIAPITINPSSGGGGSMERQRLKLMREQFSEQKRQNLAQEELRRLAEGNEMTRANLLHQQAQQKIAAEQAAARKKAKTEGMAEFTKLAGSGDIEGARAMVPYLASVGQGVELLGEEGGLPSFRMFDLDDQGNEVQAPDPGIGYPTDESGSLDAPPGIQTTEEAFRRAQNATAFADETGRPSRGPDEPDYTGAVPRNVIDTGAMAMATRARLAPMLGNLIQAYPDAVGPDPDAYRRSAESTARAVADSGIPALKALDQYKSLRGGADSIIQSQIEAGAQQGRFEQQMDQRGKAMDQRLIAQGEDKARKSFADTGVKTSLDIVRISQQIEDLLTNDDPLDDTQTATLITELSRTKGSQSDKDVARALGLDAASTLDQIIAFIQKKAVGGFSRKQRESLIGFAKSARDVEKRVATDWLSNVDAAVSGPDMDRNVAVGWERYRDSVVPKWLRDEYKSTREKKQADATTGASPIPDTARIARVHNNPGNLKYAEQTGATQGEAASDGGHWAKFETFEEGLEALKGQIQKDAKRGLTVEQFVTKYAPPGSNDTAKYIADAVKALGASAGQKLSELDVEKVVAFVARKESGTEVTKKPEAPSKVDADVLDILNRSGY